MLVALGDSITAAPGAWPDRVPGEVVNLAVVGAQIPDLLAQLDAAPRGDAAVVSIGTNHVVKPGGPLEFDGLHEVADRLRRYPRVAVLPVLHRVGGGGTYRAEFTERRRLFLAALDEAGLTALPFSLRRWEWQRDDMHPNALGQKRIARQVRAWLHDAEQVVP